MYMSSILHSHMPHIIQLFSGVTEQVKLNVAYVVLHFKCHQQEKGDRDLRRFHLDPYRHRQHVPMKRGC